MRYAADLELDLRISSAQQILSQILIGISTRELLPLAIVSCRFHDVILGILHRRLLAAAALEDYKLIFECFHPAAKNQDPYLYCDYLGTPGLSDTTEGQGLFYGNDENFGHLGRLTSLYSRFRPIKPESERRVFLRHPAGQSPGLPNPSIVLPTPSSSNSRAEGYVSHNISLDTDELFSQLCVSASLGRIGTRRGIFRSLVEVSDGLVRVMRDWLGKRAHATQPEDGDTRTLWLSNHCDVGLRVRNVRERTWHRPAPILMHRDEDPAVRFVIEFEGESHLQSPGRWRAKEKPSRSAYSDDAPPS